MNTRTKLNIASLTASGMMMLNVFSKPLHIPIPEPVHWALILGVFIPLGLVFHYIKQQKQQTNAATEERTPAIEPAADPKRKLRNRLFLVMGLGVVTSFASPFLLPITGSSLGMKGDFIVGLITAVIVCSICGMRLRKV